MFFFMKARLIYSFSGPYNSKYYDIKSTCVFMTLTRAPGSRLCGKGPLGDWNLNTQNSELVGRGDGQADR